MLNFLYLIGGLFFIFTLSILFEFIDIKCEGKTLLLSSIGIIISAFIASFTLKKSIDNTNKLENLKVNRKIKSFRMILSIMINKIEISESSIKELKIQNYDNKRINHLHRKTITYLFIQSESLQRNNYIEFLENEENYFLLGEMINDIHTLEYISNIYDMQLDDLKINDNTEVMITNIKNNCKKLHAFYKKL